MVHYLWDYLEVRVLSYQRNLLGSDHLLFQNYETASTILHDTRYKEEPLTLDISTTKKHTNDTKTYQQRHKETHQQRHKETDQQRHKETDQQRHKVEGIHEMFMNQSYCFYKAQELLQYLKMNNCQVKQCIYIYIYIFFFFNLFVKVYNIF